LLQVAELPATKKKTSEGAAPNNNHAISVSPKLEISNSDSILPSSKETVVNQNVTNNVWKQLSYSNSLSSANVQTKCQSCNGDIYEKQADLVADKVSKGIGDHRSNANQDESVTVLPYRNQSTQKTCSDCEQQVQPKDSSASTHSSFQNSQTLNRAINAPSSGDRVNSSIQNATEKVISTDLSYARVHTDSSSNRAAASINARAFTYGKDIFMGPGESPKDTKLMSHELTHVAQQSSNKRSVQKWEGDDGDASENQQAQLSDAEIQIINNWLNGTSSEYSAQANPIYPPGYWLNSQFSQDQGFDTSLYLAPNQDDRVHLPNFNSFPDYRTSPFDHRYGFPELTNTQCPSSCHQVAGAFRAEAARRQQAARNRARLDNWGGLHQDQHGEALSQQGPDLNTEIASSEFLITQIRAQMLETAASESPNLGLDTNVHTTWAAAQQATILLESFLQSSNVDFELSLQGSIKQTYHLFFSSLIGALREEDRIAQAREDMLNNANPCPSCHSTTTPELPAFDYGMYQQPSVMPSLFDQPSNSPQSMTLSAFVNGLAEPAEQVQEEPVGERVQRLADIQGRIINAGDRSSWQEIVADFEWATGQIDNVLRRLSRSNTSLKELFEQLEYSKQLLNRQNTLLQSHPNAMRVQAVFYPKPESVTELEQELSAQGEQTDVARSIPWQFYLTHTAVAGDGSLPSDFQWELHDLTAPNRASTAKVRYSPTTPERFGMTMSGDLETQLKRPPEALFEKLNDSDFFAEGMLYYNMPYDRSGAFGGETKSLATTEPWSLGDWLKAIGLSVMVIGSLVFAPFSTPALIAFGVGAAFSAAGGISDLMDKQEKGTLTNADTGRFFWDLSLDIISGVTLGVGRIARVAAAANNFQRAARLGDAWVLLRRAEYATDIANVAVFGVSTLENYQRIQNSSMTPEQKRDAINNLTITSLGMGLISVLPVASGAREIRQGRAALNIDVDPNNPGRLMAQLEPDVDAAAHTASRSSDTRPIHTVSAGHGHSYGIWPDGRITRCSPPPCPEFVELIVGELDDLRAVIYASSSHQASLMDLANDVASLRTDATRVAGESVEALEAASPVLLERTSALESRLTSLREVIEQENRTLGLGGSVEPRMSEHAADGLRSTGAERSDFASVLAEERLRGVRQEVGEGVGGIGHTGREFDFDRHTGRANTPHDSGVPLDDQGLPVFKSAFDSDSPDVMRGPGTSDDTQFMMATADLRQAIQLNPALANQFNSQQLAAIEVIQPRIPRYVWHHHQDGVRLQLVTAAEHRAVGHWGGRAQQGGRPDPRRTMP
jgi:hypothetical protein